MCLVPLLRYVPVMARINRGIFQTSHWLVSAGSHEISGNWTIIHKTHTAMLSRGGGFNETLRIRDMKIQTYNMTAVSGTGFAVLFSSCWQTKFWGPRPKLRGLWSISYMLVDFSHLSTSSKCEYFEVQASMCRRLSILQFFTAKEYLISSQDETRASVSQRIGFER